MQAIAAATRRVASRLMGEERMDDRRHYAGSLKGELNTARRREGEAVIEEALLAYESEEPLADWHSDTWTTTSVV